MLHRVAGQQCLQLGIPGTALLETMLYWLYGQSPLASFWLSVSTEINMRVFNKTNQVTALLNTRFLSSSI